MTTTRILSLHLPVGIDYDRVLGLRKGRLDFTRPEKWVTKRGLPGGRIQIANTRYELVSGFPVEGVVPI